MELTNIIIQGITADLQDTDVVQESVCALKELLRDRADFELVQLERRRSYLLELKGEAPAPAPQENKPLGGRHAGQIPEPGEPCANVERAR